MLQHERQMKDRYTRSGGGMDMNSKMYNASGYAMRHRKKQEKVQGH